MLYRCEYIALFWSRVSCICREAPSILSCRVFEKVALLFSQKAKCLFFFFLLRDYLLPRHEVNGGRGGDTASNCTGAYCTRLRLDACRSLSSPPEGFWCILLLFLGDLDCWETRDSRFVKYLPPIVFIERIGCCNG